MAQTTTIPLGQLKCAFCPITLSSKTMLEIHHLSKHTLLYVQFLQKIAIANPLQSGSVSCATIPTSTAANETSPQCYSSDRTGASHSNNSCVSNTNQENNPSKTLKSMPRKHKIDRVSSSSSSSDGEYSSSETDRAETAPQAKYSHKSERHYRKRKIVNFSSSDNADTSDDDGERTAKRRKDQKMHPEKSRRKERVFTDSPKLSKMADSRTPTISFRIGSRFKGQNSVKATHNLGKQPSTSTTDKLRFTVKPIKNPRLIDYSNH